MRHARRAPAGVEPYPEWPLDSPPGPSSQEPATRSTAATLPLIRAACCPLRFGLEAAPRLAPDLLDEEGQTISGEQT
jgi:hypothetical protein